jgi:SnoaL-like domain
MEDDVERVHRAFAHRDWPTLRQLLHPYLHWTDARGDVVRGRTRVLSMLEHSEELPAPASVEMRDGQIYRWTCS